MGHISRSLENSLYDHNVLLLALYYIKKVLKSSLKAAIGNRWTLYFEVFPGVFLPVSNESWRQALLTWDILFRNQIMNVDLRKSAQPTPSLLGTYVLLIEKCQDWVRNAVPLRLVITRFSFTRFTREPDLLSLGPRCFQQQGDSVSAAFSCSFSLLF